jgi:hypothetical protein
LVVLVVVEVDVMDGYAYWRSRLAPLAAQGYRRGVVTPTAVIVFDDEGRRVLIPRPGRRWIGGPDLDAVLEEDREPRGETCPRSP